MFETELFQVEAVNKGVDEPYRVFFVNVFVDGVWERALFGLCGFRLRVRSWLFSCSKKLDLSLTVSSKQRKRLFTQSDLGLSPVRPAPVF